ncbi:MAG: hypothetical protein ACRDRJ_13055, partial [Streptosporangiaceae bacterium]
SAARPARRSRATRREPATVRSKSGCRRDACRRGGRDSPLAGPLLAGPLLAGPLLIDAGAT